MSESSSEHGSSLPNLTLGEGDPAALERRVQRLEEAVAGLQDTSLLEERILERLRDRPQVKLGPAPPGDERIRADQPPPAPEPLDSQASPPKLSGLAEFRAMVRMFFDIHYHIAWTTRILVIVLIALIWTSGWWFLPAWVPVVGVLFDKTFDIILAFLLYRVLSAEARRYAQYQVQRRLL